MYACVIETEEGQRLYSSFFIDSVEAITYAENHSGVVAVKRAHSNEKPIWERKP